MMVHPMPAARRQRRSARLVALALLTSLSCPAIADPLIDGFEAPPAESRPRVWWHWMNGNISQDGIAKDLEWMQRIGIGGVQTFDASLQTPSIVPPVRYMSPAWKDAFRFATREADRRGLELAIASSPGFSETGAPFVAPRDAMKKLVWSEAVVEGGRTVRLTLPALPDTVGAFQSLPSAGQVGQASSPTRPLAGDVVVLAYRLPSVPVLTGATATAITGEALDAAPLSDGSYKDGVRVPAGAATAPGGVVLSFDRPRRVQSATMHIPGKTDLLDLPLSPVLEASLDGKSWRPIAPMPIEQVPTTVSFAPIEARFFRLVLNPNDTVKPSYAAPAPGVANGERFSLRMPPARSVRISEFTLGAEPRIDRFESKAGFAVEPNYAALNRAPLPDSRGIDPRAIVDVSAHMGANGTLDWKAPPGSWRIIRFGWSLTGKLNHPAAPEATGLEVDKLDAGAVQRYIDTYLDQYSAVVGPDLIGGHGVRALLNDSIEAGAANWTPLMIAQFKRLRGYDPTPWLPALTGTIVGDRSRSDGFLDDYRRTLSELIASEHYGTIAATARARGLISYQESLEGNTTTLGDDIAMRAQADVPMAAIWTYSRKTGPAPGYLIDMKGAASIAHLHGRSRVAAEMFTTLLAPWASSPADLRPVADLAFAQGINLPVIHTSVHQPLDKAPGLPFFIIGQYFTRLESWASMADAWIGYLSRSGYLLQQGQNVADVGYIYGDGATPAGLFGQTPIADAPSRHAYDLVDGASLRDLTSVDGGDVVTRGGARYRVLYLGAGRQPLLLATLRRLDALVTAGATLVGLPPAQTPSLADDAAEYRRLVGKLWTGQAVTRVGQGQVMATTNLDAALATNNIAPDFTSDAAPGEILYAHRHRDDADIYFVTNRTDRALRLNARFRVSGKAPQIWRADTGAIQDVSFRQDAGSTLVPLDLAAGDSYFVVFRGSNATERTVQPRTATPMVLGKPWTVAFEKGRGAPSKAKLSNLTSLSENALPGIRYFSGVATYKTSFDLPKGKQPPSSYSIDLGQVGDMAQVFVNDRPVGTTWHAPYRLDITKAVRPGHNRLEVRVADLWVNRLIGDAQPNATKIASTPLPTYRADAPLRPSGLIGPVSIIEEQ